MSTLIHSCCGPCLAHNINHFKEFRQVVLFWYNPNIHPYMEFQRRLENFRTITLSENVIIDDTYDLEVYFNSIAGKKKRCEGCYELRLERTAEVAKSRGFESFSTTLTTSPHQDHELIKQTGDKLSKKYQLEFLYLDLRDHYNASKSEARRLGLYLQPYCGCIWSEAERYKRGNER